MAIHDGDDLQWDALAHCVYSVYGALMVWREGISR